MAASRFPSFAAGVLALTAITVAPVAPAQMQMPAPRGSAAAAPAPRVPAAPARAPVSLDRTIPLDRVVAIVNDEALTQYEINEQKRVALQQMKSQNVTPPPPDALDKQLLDRLITERVLLQLAKENGIRVDDVTVEKTIQRIGQENKLTPDQFRAAVEKEGIPYSKYREDIRNEILVQRLRDREVDSRISVSDAEVDHFLATINAQSGGDVEYRLSHVLVLVPEQATPDQIDAKRRRADEALKQIQGGTDFAQVAAGFSDAPDALQGGSLGWRPPARLPTVFADTVRGMKAGDVSGLLRSAAGFHIVKLLETRSRVQQTVVEQTRARHILVKVSEITSEADGKAKIDRIRERIDLGAPFDEQAKLNSEDGSSNRGGDLGWLSPGDTVPDFEQAMGKLKPGEISPPVRSPFGWHLIQVQDRRTQDITAERQREQARQALRQRKSDEAFQDWVRQMRDRAYVEIKSDDR
ncbi:MAG: peptidylprolyl isomerase [Betaproteobacteria bacterium]